MMGHTFSKKSSSDFLAARRTVDLNNPSLMASAFTPVISTLAEVAMTELWGTRVKGTPLMFLGPECCEYSFEYSPNVNMSHSLTNENGAKWVYES